MIVARTRRLVLPSAVMAIGLALAACGTDTTAGPSDTTTTTDTTDTSTTTDTSVGTDTGDTASTCENTCDDEGGKSCDGNAVLECRDSDDDGCLEWVELIACGEGTTCRDGTCALACPAAPCNVVGAKRCDAGGVQTCGDSDDDGCLDWSTAVACDDGLVCSNGFCALDCSDACTTVGAKKCEGDSVVSCADHDDNGCLEWGGAVACEDDESCSGGFCAATCSDECSTANSTRCDGNGVATCGQIDADDCLEWGTVVACDQGEVCSNGACATTCTSECSTIGAKSCDGQSVITCEDPNTDGCFTWSSPVPCGDGLTCAGGQCAQTCTNDCTAIGAKACDLGGKVITCGDYDTDDCLEWSTGTTCGDGLVCSSGNCAVTCTSTCAAIGLRQCAAGTTGSYQLCDDHNDDGCLEWGTATACGGALVCSGGQCESTCTSTCTGDGSAACDGNARRICGDYNNDDCLELGTPIPCALTEECVAGACEPLDPPAVVIINEVVLNSAGNPDLDTFIELHAPAGTELDGFTLVGVNGNGGAAYVTVPLSGIVGSDGLFVVAHPDAALGIAAMADLEDEGVDFQNGPDSIQVRFGATTLDALAYGTFDGDDVFAGEGDAAPAPGVDEALARDEDHTDTNDNAADFELVTQSPGVVNGPANVAPDAAITCPSGVLAGASGNVDASDSSDPDGTIVTYRFDFGDGSAIVSGAAAEVTHAWTAAGSYTVTLRVTDDGGLTDEVTCQAIVVDGNAPTTTLIKPAAQKQVTQGEAVQLLADATPASGRTIAEVTFWAAGVQVGSDTSAPFEATYTVPANAPTGVDISVEARARDSVGAIGVSPPKVLRVLNDAPVAAFTATVTGSLQVTADATASYDTETAAGAIEVRWDWESDGAFDTAWSTTRLVTRTYPSVGTKTITLEVRDAIGQVSSATRSVDLALVQNVSGSVNTTTWVGTIVVSGDVTVPAGQTLTIAAGTTVLFAPIDQGGDGTGDFDLIVNGALVVQGTLASPVVFTTYGTETKAPSDWSTITLKGAGSSVQHAVIEYADIGLVIEGNAQVADVEIRSARRGIVFQGSANGARVDRANIHDQTDHGVVATSSAIATLAASTVRQNGGAGVAINGNAKLDVTESTIRDNALAGLEITGNGRGTITKNLVTDNGLEGVRIALTGAAAPTTLVINTNNIYGNATVGARIMETTFATASSTTAGTGTINSLAWPTANGEHIEWAYFNYYEDDTTSNWVTATWLGDEGVTLRSTATSSNVWVDISGYETTTVRSRVVDNQTYTSGSASVGTIAYTQAGAVRELSVVNPGGTIDLRYNHWGVFANPLGVISLGAHTDANIQGFRGEAYDGTWTRAPYVGGDTLAADATWSGVVYVTGNVTTAGGTTLTIEEGTTVRFAPVDQNDDGYGDYSITTNGALVVDGASSAKVRFTSLSDSPAPRDWERLRARGATTIGHADIEYGAYGLVIDAAAPTAALSDIDIHHNGNEGLSLQNKSGTATRITSRDNLGTGVWIAAGSGATFAIDRLVSKDNGGHGLHVRSTSAGYTVTNSRFTNNGGNGVDLLAASIGIAQSEVSYNSEGLRYLGASGGTVTACDIKYNDREGIVLLSRERANPTPAITGSNVFGNSVVESAVLAQPGTAAASTTAGTGTINSATWGPGGGKLIRYFEASYSEDDTTSNWVSGLIQDTNGDTHFAASIPRSRQFMDVWDLGITGLQARVTDNQTYTSGTMTIHQALHDGGTASIEVVALVDSGKVTLTGNYWGVFPDVQSRMTLSRADAVDFQGFQLGAIAGTGPQ